MRLQAQLAEVGLSRVQRINERTPHTIPGSVVAEYSQDVEVANARLQAVIAQQRDQPFAPWLRRAKVAADAAEHRWKNAMATNQAAPGAVDELELKRLRLRADLARVQFAQAQALAEKPTELQVPWQLSFLQDSVEQLQETVERNPPVTRSYPIWRWRW